MFEPSNFFESRSVFRRPSTLHVVEGILGRGELSLKLLLGRALVLVSHAHCVVPVAWGVITVLGRMRAPMVS
jgi:hypothetical protein